MYKTIESQPKTRRGFLKSAAIAGATAAILPRRTFAAPADNTYFAGAAEREITPPIGMEITHFVRENIGVHDPLYVRAIVLRDSDGKQIALVDIPFGPKRTETRAHQNQRSRLHRPH